MGSLPLALAQYLREPLGLGRSALPPLHVASRLLINRRLIASGPLVAGEFVCN
jgi:hypothetical protein